MDKQSLERITVLPGEKLILNELDWQEFEEILAELGENGGTRIAYDQGILEIMSPLPEHETDKLFISDFVGIILEELDIEFYPLGSTTFKSKLMRKGIEPDNCFYIANEKVIRGKDKLDLSIDPPPDLALEIDVTSRTYSDLKKGVRGKYIQPLKESSSSKVKITGETGDRYVKMKTVEVEAFVNHKGELTVQIPSDLREGQYQAVLIVEIPSLDNS